MPSFFKSKSGAILEIYGNPFESLGSEWSALSPRDPSLEGKEKHVPELEMEGNKAIVRVGSVPHPMLPEHFIQWIYVRTDKGTYRKELRPGEEPKAVFLLGDGEKVLEILSYCNLHGLWESR